jgi:beta-galactosidase
MLGEKAPDVSLTADGSESPRRRFLLDSGWRFHLGDIPFPVISGHGASYHYAKAGAAVGAAAPDFDDSGDDWRDVNLPHDWAMDLPIDRNANLSQGFRQRGIGWYRRSFKINPDDRGKHFELQFDGVSTHCTVWVNGLVAHRNFCGYTSFQIDITPFLRFGDDLNTVVVRVDANEQEGWWYEGAGIYRHTWLAIRDPLHIKTNGLYAKPERDAKGKWSVPLEVALFNSGEADASTVVNAVLLDQSGTEIAKESAPVSVLPLGEATALLHVSVPGSPQLWSVDHPNLYTIRVDVVSDGKTLDTAVEKIGFRTIRFDAKTGFYLNEQPLKLKGTCNHQDHAGVGVAVPDSLWDFRIRKLKEMGSNAYRCAHNPPSAEFLDACDRLGMLVMDETRNFNTTEEYVRQLEGIVRRDRNHPSVILWSVFNEEPFQGSEQGYEMVRRMSAAVKRLDALRPVTAAQSGGIFNPLNATMAADVAGLNYQSGAYAQFHKAYPDKPVLSSEDGSAVMTRGEYETDLNKRFVIDSYDTQWQRWGRNQRTAWRQIDEQPFMAGGFVWTGFDYRGEPQPLNWPATGSSFGILDQCGFPKSAFYIRQAMWIKDKPILYVIPHWNWPGRENQPIKVMAISNAEEVELFVNGKSQGRKKNDPYDMIEWPQVPYEPGELEAIAYRGRAEVGRFAVRTTGPAVALELVPDRSSLRGDGLDAQPVTVRAVDVAGNVVPDSHPMATLTTSGPGAVIGIANGDPLCHEPEKALSHSLYHGLASAIVQSSRGGSGSLTLTASAEGLKPAKVTIYVEPVSGPPMLEPAPRGFLVQRWRMSPVTMTPPDPQAKINETDMNTWTAVDAGKTQRFAGGRFAMFRTTIKPPAFLKKDAGTLLFKGIEGKSTIWIDGTLAATTGDETQARNLSIPLNAGTADLTVSVIVEAHSPDTNAGLSGVVEVQRR